MNRTKILFILCFCLFLTQCAKRGIPEGGPIDDTPPTLINAIPKENSINFNEKRIRLFFDEYIKLEDFRKQLVVSPPIDKSLYSMSVIIQLISIIINVKMQNDTIKIR